LLVSRRHWKICRSTKISPIHTWLAWGYIRKPEKKMMRAVPQGCWRHVCHLQKPVRTWVCGFWKPVLSVWYKRLQS